MWKSERKNSIVSCGSTYKAHGLMVLISQRAFCRVSFWVCLPLLRTASLFCVQGRNMEESHYLSHFLMCFPLQTNSYSQAGKWNDRGADGWPEANWHGTDTSLQLDYLTPPEQDDCTKIVCWGSANPWTKCRYWGKACADIVTQSSLNVKK